jgi:hypothetical protein
LATTFNGFTVARLHLLHQRVAFPIDEMPLFVQSSSRHVGILAWWELDVALRNAWRDSDDSSRP